MYGYFTNKCIIKSFNANTFAESCYFHVLFVITQLHMHTYMDRIYPMQYSIDNHIKRLYRLNVCIPYYTTRSCVAFHASKSKESCTMSERPITRKCHYNYRINTEELRNYVLKLCSLFPPRYWNQTSPVTANAPFPKGIGMEAFLLLFHSMQKLFLIFLL